LKRILKLVQSSQIKAIGYDPKNRVATIEFRTKTKRSVYEYQNVEPELAASILFAESIGRRFGETLKADPDAYPFRRLGEGEASAIRFEERPEWMAALEKFRPEEVDA
jgi:hypothetical protein